MVRDETPEFQRSNYTPTWRESGVEQLVTPKTCEGYTVQDGLHVIYMFFEGCLLVSPIYPIFLRDTAVDTLVVPITSASLD